jgi:hypothetical protein
MMGQLRGQSAPEEGAGFIRKILDAPKPVREEFQPILSSQL